MNDAALPEITVHDVEGRLAAGSHLLDVRENDEWAAGRAPAAHHIRLSDLGDRTRDLPKDTEILCMCKAGGRSARATTALLEAGYNAVNVAGGMTAWAAAGLTVVDQDGSPGTVL